MRRGTPVSASEGEPGHVSGALVGRVQEARPTRRSPPGQCPPQGSGAEQPEPRPAPRRTRTGTSSPPGRGPHEAAVRARPRCRRGEASAGRRPGQHPSGEGCSTPSAASHGRRVTVGARFVDHVGAGCRPGWKARWRGPEPGRSAISRCTARAPSVKVQTRTEVVRRTTLTAHRPLRSAAPGGRAVPAGVGRAGPSRCAGGRRTRPGRGRRSGTDRHGGDAAGAVVGGQDVPVVQAEVGGSVTSHRYRPPGGLGLVPGHAVGGHRALGRLTDGVERGRPRRVPGPGRRGRARRWVSTGP